MHKTLPIMFFAVPMSLFAAAAANAGADDLVPLDECLETAHEVHQGEFVKVEFLSVSAIGAPSYEIELRDDSGTEWELMCNARTGDIYELETEAESAQDNAFAKTAKISEDEARRTAKDRFGGEIIELEYEIESDGSPTYEIDLLQPGQNNEFKIEVDAVSGDIIEMSVEQWQIGQEPSEEIDSSDDSATQS